MRIADGHSIAKLAGAVAACEAAGGIGDFLSREGLQEWYPQLHKPSFNPPGWVFGPTWTLLYALMGTSLWLAEERGEDGAAKLNSRVFFGGQLLLNVLWTYVFCGRRAPVWAFVEVLLLLAAELLSDILSRGNPRGELFGRIIFHLDYMARIDEEDYGGHAAKYIRQRLIPFCEREGRTEALAWQKRW